MLSGSLSGFPLGVMFGDMRACSGYKKFLLFVPMIFFLPHMLSVLKLQEQLNSQDLYKEKPKKSNHLVLGPAAGVGLADRLQCKGIRALNKTLFSSHTDNSDYRDQISFVTVFTTYNSSADGQENKKFSELVTVGNMLYNKMERSLAVLDVFINFIQRTMSRSNIIILTNPSSKLPIVRDRVVITPIQGEYSRDKLMLQRIMSYIAFLEARLEERSQEQGQVSHYIFTDSDIAVIGDLSQFFYAYPNFHLALTFRNNKEQPLNSGFVAVRGTVEGMRRAKAFLEQVLKVYTSRYMKASRMLGDQLALAWAVKSQHSFDARMFTNKQPFLHEISGASVLFLPCAIYNWTPPEGAGQFHGMPLDVKHAADEKYNYERLAQTTVLNQQPLLRPLRMELSPEEEIVISMHSIRKNGFSLEEDVYAAPRRQFILKAVPFSKNITFGVTDVKDILSILADSHGECSIIGSYRTDTSDSICTPRVCAILASRTCRSSVMIGDPLGRNEMQKILEHTANLKSWNCPHGRPTMRHLVDITTVYRKINEEHLS